MDFASRKNTVLVLETVSVFVGMSLLAVYLHRIPVNETTRWFLYAPLLLFQGLWFYRFYIVGHEASHYKLFPENKALNDIAGSLVLLPLMVPINIFRKIHMFHHGFNRKDNHTSALDTFTTKNLTPLKKLYFYVLWYIGVFLGGFFIHSFVSVFLFLFVPPALATKISPAFKGWQTKDQLLSIALFSLGICFHLSVYYIFGTQIYLLVLGYPMLSFAWVLSLFVYIFHYNTTVGKHVRYNVRSVKKVPFFSWVLMNFNEHATHHQHPNIPWYDLPAKRQNLPEEFSAKNQNTWSLFKAISQQLKGPRIIDESEYKKVSH